MGESKSSAASACRRRAVARGACRGVQREPARSAGDHERGRAGRYRGHAAAAERGGGRAAFAVPVRAGKRIVVRPGQSVGYLAGEYGVSKRAIIEANHLTPPEYKIEIGKELVIPGASEPRAPVHAAAEPKQTAEPPPPEQRGRRRPARQGARDHPARRTGAGAAQGNRRRLRRSAFRRRPLRRAASCLPRAREPAAAPAEPPKGSRVGGGRASRRAEAGSSPGRCAGAFSPDTARQRGRPECRDQHRRFPRRTGPGGRFRRRRLCRQRDPRLRQSRARQASERLDLSLRPSRFAARQARRHGQPRPSHRQGRRYRRGQRAAAAFRAASRQESGRSARVPGRRGECGRRCERRPRLNAGTRVAPAQSSALGGPGRDPSRTARLRSRPGRTAVLRSRFR